MNSLLSGQQGMQQMMTRLAGTMMMVCGFAVPGLAQESEFDCIVNPAIIVKIGSPVSGLIDQVFVEPGDLVETGAPIASLRSEVERTTIMVIEEEANSMAEIEAQRARMNLAQSRLKRAEQLVKRGAATKTELETARAEMDVISRELAAAEMRQRVSKLELDRARQQLAQRTINSPIDGVVVERVLYNGEFLHQDSHVAVIAQIDPLTVEAFLPVTIYNDIRVGAGATISPDAPVTGVFAGVVKVVDRVFDAASGTFGVQISLENPNYDIPAGHRCKVSFTG